MKNPYEILGIRRKSNVPVTQEEVLTAVAESMRKAPRGLKDCLLAQRQLVDPVERAIVDFLFPAETVSDASSPGVETLDLTWKWDEH